MYELRDGARLIVGRAPSSDIPIIDPTISRRHAELESAEDGFHDARPRLQQRDVRERLARPDGNSHARRSGRVRQGRRFGCSVIAPDVAPPEPVSAPTPLIPTIVRQLLGSRLAGACRARHERLRASIPRKIQRTAVAQTRRTRASRSSRPSSRSRRDWASPSTSTLCSRRSSATRIRFSRSIASPSPCVDVMARSSFQKSRATSEEVEQPRARAAVDRTEGSRGQSRDSVRQRGRGRPIRRSIDPDAADSELRSAAHWSAARTACSACCTSTTLTTTHRFSEHDLEFLHRVRRHCRGGGIENQPVRATYSEG